jgi:hypothetical protein
MNASAINAVDESAAKFRIMLSGRTITSCAAISHLVAMNVLQLVTASTKAWRFSATKIVYADIGQLVSSRSTAKRSYAPATNPIWDNAIEVKMTERILGPYRTPPMSTELSALVVTAGTHRLTSEGPRHDQPSLDQKQERIQ